MLSGQSCFRARWVSSLALVFAIHASAGEVDLRGIADGDSIYIEQQSSAFFQMDLYDPPPRQTQQRFHDITNPSVTFGSLAFDGFPNDEDFRLGSLTYDDSGLVGGNGVAPITGIELNIFHDPDDSSYINYGRWVNVVNETIVDTFVGSVTLAGGVVTAINMTSNVHLHFLPIGTVFLDAPGTFTVSGVRFEGYFEVNTTPTTKMIWDFAGTLTTVAVPEVSTLSMVSLCAIGMLTPLGLRRLRNRRDAALTM